MKIIVTIEIETAAPLPDEVLGAIRSETAMISQKVQETLDRIRETKSIVQAVMESEKVQTEQIATLTQKVTDLQGKIDAGQTVNQDDLAALAEIASDIDNVNAQLRTAIPKNTVADPNANMGGAGAGLGSQGGTAPSMGGGNEPARRPGSSQEGGQREPNEPGRELNNATQGSGEQSVQEAEAERARQQSGGGEKPKPLPGTGAE